MSKDFAPVVYAEGISSVTIQDLKIDGSEASTLPAETDNYVGLFLAGTGATVASVTVADFLNYPGSMLGYNMYIYANSSTVSVEIDNCTISGVGRGGMQCIGDGLTMNIHDCTVTGPGVRHEGEWIANGILVWDLATGVIAGNTVSYFAYDGTGWIAEGIDASGATSVTANTATDCQCGIGVWGDGTDIPSGTISGNIISATGLVGSEGDGVSGITVDAWGGGAASVTISDNDLSGGGPGHAITLGGEWDDPDAIDAAISGNTLTNWNAGIFLGDSDDEIIIYENWISSSNSGAVGIYVAATTTITNIEVTGNDLSSNDSYAFGNDAGGTVNASGNWWGDASGPSTAKMGSTLAEHVLSLANPNRCDVDEMTNGRDASQYAEAATGSRRLPVQSDVDNTEIGTGDALYGSVDYTPWLDVGTDTEPSTPGFQGDFSVLWVDDDSPQIGAVERIQEGVNVVVSSTVNLAPGTYEEQVLIAKEDFTLSGSGNGSDPGGNSIVLSPVSLSYYFTTGDYDNYPIIGIDDATGVTIDNIRVDGNGRGNNNYRFVGIAYYNADGNITECAITGITDTPFTGAQHGNGVYTWNTTGGPYTINITDTDVDDFQKNGLTLSGESLTVDVTGCTVTGVGETDVTAQNGIQIGYSAGGTVSSCDVSGFTYTPADYYASGVLLYNGASVDISETTVSQCQAGIWYINTDGTLTNSSIVDPTQDGLYFDNEATKGDLSDNRVQPHPMEEAYEGTHSRSPNSIDVSGCSFVGTGASGSAGIYPWAEGDVTMNVSHCEVTNWDNGVYFEDVGGTLVATFENDSIYGNTSYGFYSELTVASDAQCNWWGSATGPYHEVTNTLGQGNAVSDFVTYEPWSDAGFTNCDLTVDRDTVWVSENYTPLGLNDDHVWNYDAFDNITDGVIAVRVDGVVVVLDGTYEEQVVISKNLTLTGDIGDDPTILSPDNLTEFFTTSGGDKYPIVYVHDVDDVSIKNLTVDGAGKGNANYQFLGIAFRNAGGLVDSVEITDVRDTPFSGAQHGVAMYLYNDDAVARSMTVSDCDIHNFQKNAMALNAASNTPLTVDVSSNVITGYGPTDITAQNGVQVWADLATGSVTGNTITGIAYDNTEAEIKWVASSILNYYADLDIIGNNVSNGHVGIYNIDGAGQLNGNDIEIEKIGVFAFGIIASDPPGAKPSPFDPGQPASQSRVTLVVEVSGNTVTFNGTDNSSTYGIEADAGWGPNDLSFAADYNLVTGFEVGIELYMCEESCDTGVFTDVSATSNSLAGNDIGMRSNASYILVDASGNYWGSTDPVAVSGQASGDIDYTPWLGSGTPTYPGFQGDFSELWVDDDSPQSGTSRRIQEGIEDVDDSKGGSIWVVDGHYYESVNFLGRAVTIASLFAADSDTLHILSTVIDADEDSIGISDTSSVVYFVSGEGATSALRGFTLQNGTGTQNTSDNNRETGGAIYCDGSSPVIANCIIHRNTAVRGGAVGCVGSNPTFSNCTITGNDALTGSGFYCNESSPIVTNSTIAFNNEGAGIDCMQGDDSAPDLSCCVIFGNNGGDWTGCIYGQDTINGNLHQDPQFCDTTASDYRINYTSPCDIPNNGCGVIIGVLGAGCEFQFYVCGDANGSGDVDIDDVVFLINYIFSGGDAPDPYQAGNADCSIWPEIDIDDVVYLINYIFAGGPSPCDPDGDEVPDC